MMNKVDYINSREYEEDLWDYFFDNVHVWLERFCGKPPAQSLGAFMAKANAEELKLIQEELYENHKEHHNLFDEKNGMR